METFVDVEAALDSFKNNDFELETASIRTWKHPDDLNRYHAIILRDLPDVVVECGTAWGGSALWFARHGVDVITIDTRKRRSLRARMLPGAERVTWVNGMSTGAATFRRVRQMVEGRRVMVCLDSDHSTANVLREINLYGPLVSPGCHLVVEDGIFELIGVDGKPWGGNLFRGGPLRAIAQTLVGNSDWTRDIDIEQLTKVTHSPAGWWIKNV